MIETSWLKNRFFVLMLVLVAISDWKWAINQIREEQFRFEVRRGIAELIQANNK
jgi:hypothetical protein